MRMALFILVILGLAGLCHFAVNHKSAEKEKLASPPLDRTVAEGLRLWNPKAGVDSIRFDSCRVEKMRMGFFALGAFNVLCIKGLVLNLPLEDSGPYCRRLDGSPRQRLPLRQRQYGPLPRPAEDSGRAP